MAEINRQQPNLSVGINIENMAERIFNSDDPEQLIDALNVAQEIVKEDKGFKWTFVRRGREESKEELVIETTEAGHWMSPSGEVRGMERQAYVFMRLGGVGLA